MEYSYVRTDESGNEVVIAGGEFEPGAVSPDVGATVTLKGADGVDRAWRIVRKIPVAYTGETIYVEPLEFGSAPADAEPHHLE